MNISHYIDTISARFKKGDATEHTYRGDLQTLIESIVPGVIATNEPKRIDCGAPDYILTKKNIPVGYIEAKDIDDIDIEGKKSHKEQFDRYRKSLENLIITDYIDFHFYKLGEQVTSIRIGKVDGKKIVPLAEKFDEFTSLIKDFCEYKGQTIKSSKTLAEMMAGKARMLANVIENAINSDEEKAADSSLKEQMAAFKDILIHDIKPKEFADIYAQTVAYGMFAARLHDHTLDNFTRQEAAELIPKSNPFLRKLFGYIAGPDIDERIIWIVDALADIFKATDVAELLKNFGKATKQEDPIIHFYETFLAEYDPKLRKARGVWYTPAPVVNFIVRAVDDILKTEFKLHHGLADKSKVKIKTKAFTKATADRRSKVKEVEKEEEVHKVQILDPATGTGTFLAEVIKLVHKNFEGQQGVWSNYVEEHLVPRLNGFELLMASYAMAHLQLDLLLTQTGYKPKKQNRLRVFLTNSLEEHHPDTGTLFASWLSAEANEANHIKRDTPVMVVMGNPPYSGISSNNGEWISNLIEDYKYIDGEHFNERKHWLNDDYVKFLRYGEHFIEKNGSGILAFINPHGFLDNPTFRGMRWHLLKTYDKIYTIDLHGNSTKQEMAPDGSKDENVFDIMQGVSINLFIKTGKKKDNELAKVLHFDVFGKREIKYDFLNGHSLKKIEFALLKPEKPNLFFVPKNNDQLADYNTGFLVSDLLPIQSMGVTSARDGFVIDFDKNMLSKRVKDFCDKDLTTSEFQSRYNLKENYQWKVAEQRKLVPVFNMTSIKVINYRPFDNRYIYYQDNIVFRSRRQIMDNLLMPDNFALNLVKLGRNVEAQNYFITNSITDKSIISSLDNSNTFPLYIYPVNKAQKSLYDKHERTPNLNREIVEKIAVGLGLELTNEKGSKKNSFAPIDLLDYIYAVVHNPTYREKYKEFLKIDFPRVPYPKDIKTFWQLVKLGGELRQIHLLESPMVDKPITKFPVDGDNLVGKVKHEREKVWINDTQYFDKVPQIAWEFYIGGYQPAQKWLKDRKESKLTYDDIEHYQKIIVALSETDRIMMEIDKIKID